jgi:hypothetical protein
LDGFDLNQIHLNCFGSVRFDLNRQHNNRAPPVIGFSSSPVFWSGPPLPRRAPARHRLPPPAARLAGCQAPFFLFHTPSRAPILSLSHSPLWLKANKLTGRPERQAAAALSSDRSPPDFITPAISPKAGSVTTPSYDECHYSLPRCPSFAV